MYDLAFDVVFRCSEVYTSREFCFIYTVCIKFGKLLKVQLNLCDIYVIYDCFIFRFSRVDLCNFYNKLMKISNVNCATKR